MRIISGKWKSRTIDFPKNREFRPTQDRVKESLFSIIASKLPDSIVWDLCAGSGGLGIEALSRGATHVTFVDLDITYIQKNTKFLSSVTPPLVKDQFKIIKSTAKRFLTTATPNATLILMDPPWSDTETYIEILTHPTLIQAITQGATLVCEFKTRNKPQLPPELIIQKEYKYGSSTLAIITKTT